MNYKFEYIESRNYGVRSTGGVELGTILGISNLCIGLEKDAVAARSAR